MERAQHMHGRKRRQFFEAGSPDKILDGAFAVDQGLNRALCFVETGDGPGDRARAENALPGDELLLERLPLALTALHRLTKIKSMITSKPTRI